MVALLVVTAVLWPGPASAIDPGDGTMVASQQIRRPLAPVPGKVTRLDTSREKPDHTSAKAELSVHQVWAMHFGSLCDNDGSVTLGVADAIIDDPDNLVYGGTPQSGVILFTGDAFAALTVDISGSAGDGFVLSDFATNQGAPPLAGLTLDDTGQLTLVVGARLQLDSSQIGSGSGQSVGWTISAVYE
jgi:hypothetical protein